MNLDALYADHLQQLDLWLADAVQRANRAGCSVDAVVFHSGRQEVYHRDDRLVIFQPNGHFRRWVPPLNGPEHVVLARPGAKPIVVRVRPKDFWYDTSPAPESHWETHVDLHEVERFDQVPEVLGKLGRAAFFGEHAGAAAALGMDPSMIEPDALLFPLDWYRATKTEYEVALTRVACQAAAKGHLDAKDRFLAGADERQLHWGFLQATGHLEHEIPYETIVALDAKSAILHYQFKRGPEYGPGKLLLLDAGAGHCGYAADITRTFVRDDIHPVMAQLRDAVDAMERKLVAMVTPGRSYVDIHLETHRQIAGILTELGVLKMSAEQAVESRLTRTFMPHGVGHLIGLQVHDVGGHQAGPEGGDAPPPDGHVLRNTRTLEPGHLVTIEPGVYFIPMLLEPLRQGDQASAVNWSLVDELIPCGGVRIEDNVLCTGGEPDDLTRGLIEGAGGS